jgi:CheY-like chemotaxis protein
VNERPLILVVEDEYFLQADVVDTLTKGGFEAEAVYSGEEALTLFLNGRPYRVLITDVRLNGGLTGWELARRIREKEPSFPVIYLTASAVEEWTAEGVPNSILMPKPFTTARLISTLSRLLNADIEANASKY